MLFPMGVVGGWKIGTQMHASRFLPARGRFNHKSRNSEEILQLPATLSVKLPNKYVAAPVLDRLPCFCQAVGFPADTH